MKINESFSQAFQNIWANKMRSFLTMLGIIIGIASVMVIIGLGNGMEAYMEGEFQSLGTNTLNIQMTGMGSSRKITVEEMYEIVKDNPNDFVDLSPTVSIPFVVKVGTEALYATSSTGISEKYFDIYDRTLREGRGIRYMDIESRNRICVVGAYIADEMYGGSALGETIRIGSVVYTIVGVLDAKEDEPDEGSEDDAVYVPYSTATRLNGSAYISSYVVTIVSEDRATQSKTVMEDALFKLFRSEDAYRVISMTQILDMMSEMMAVMITILAVIAGISLVVGGIGIMNIMLVSVSERTREIGIRKALGAKERYILSQFIIEAAVTSAIGGVIGIATGYGLSSIATALIIAILEVSIVVTPTMDSIILAFGASAAIGILFGFLPANKAAQLNPIDALRYE